jgi:hypothetical protein
MIMHPSQTTEAWPTYRWPAWVPASIRVQVEDIWACPMDWLRNARDTHAPSLGANIAITVDNTIRGGRYVHVRDFTGRVVVDDQPPHTYVVTLVNGRPRIPTP